jgi:uncharacterized protein (TIGR04255 family)
MPFPETARVIYGKNPLREVVCQLRFPRILKIEAEVPVEFQEHIRKQFPIYKENVPEIMPPVIREMIPGQIADALPRQRRTHEFYSKDRKWRVGLTSSFIALTTYSYDRWGNFYSRIQDLLQFFNEIYEPAFFTRIGLRYINLIDRSAIHVEQTEWRDLINPEIISFLGSPKLKETEILGSIQVVNISLDQNQGQVQIRQGLARDAEEREGYLIDSDFFIEEEIEDARPYLLSFNRQAGRVFR